MNQAHEADDLHPVHGERESIELPRDTARSNRQTRLSLKLERKLGEALFNKTAFHVIGLWNSGENRQKTQIKIH